MWFGTTITRDQVYQLLFHLNVIAVSKRVSNYTELPLPITHIIADFSRFTDTSYYDKHGDIRTMAEADYEEPQYEAEHLLHQHYPPLRISSGDAHPEMCGENRDVTNVYWIYFPWVLPSKGKKRNRNGSLIAEEKTLNVEFFKQYFQSLELSPLKQLYHDMGWEYEEPQLDSLWDHRW